MYKRGKLIPYLGTFHASDIIEFYGYGIPDFIGTDAVGVFSRPVIISILGMTYCRTNAIQLTLPILIILHSHTILRVSFLA